MEERMADHRAALDGMEHRCLSVGSYNGHICFLFSKQREGEVGCPR